MTVNIRNFAIIAHIDHGKTTLTDCLLHATGSIAEGKGGQRILDSNPIEQERGITIKLAPVCMPYLWNGVAYTLNLIDTPGHVDFGYEVSRSLAACEGVILVVDATQGVQAQTLSNYAQARALGLTVIPVVNKIDLPTADIERTTLELMELCDVDDSAILQVSARTGEGVDKVLAAIVERVPAPTGHPERPLTALLVSSYVDAHRGAVGLVRVMDGQLTKQRLRFMASDLSFQPLEIGTFRPELTPQAELETGAVGYVATGLKDVRSLKIGDTLTTEATAAEVTPLPGYREPESMVLLEVYPADSAEFTLLQDALTKLSLRDAALQFTGTHSLALGSGFRVGFLGILHAEVALERIRREFDLAVIATSPTVTYRAKLVSGAEILIKSPGELPDKTQLIQVEEPVVQALIYAPADYVAACLELIRQRRGFVTASRPVGSQTEVMAQMPLSELITDFHDRLKSLSSGYASLSYELAGYQPADVVRVNILIHHESVEALGFLTVADQADSRARALVAALAKVVPRQAFEVPIQATIGGKIVARDTIKAFRKDVTAKLYGGDVTRRMKLLRKQAKGKKRMRQFGKLELDTDVFLQVLKR